MWLWLSVGQRAQARAAAERWRGVSNAILRAGVGGIPPTTHTHTYLILKKTSLLSSFVTLL